MAKSFGSGAEIKSYIIAQMKPAVKEVQEKVRKTFEDYLYAYYGEYQPVVSERTWQLFDSLVKTNVVRTGNGWSASVYFDIGALHHPESYWSNDWFVEKKWSEDEIMTTALTSGTHGGTWTGVEGLKIWDESHDCISKEWLKWFKSALIAAGIPVH